MNVANIVYGTITRHEMISPGDSVLLGVSGGPDSVALLQLLDELKSLLGCTLAIAHFDHGIRAEESRQDAVFVEELAARFGMPFYLGRNAVPGDRSRGNLEAFARESRYRFFESVASRVGAAKIAVGHTRDDQAETMLMWLLRGCGPSGLGGMPPVRPTRNNASGNEQTRLIRPLIDVSRAEIMRYLEGRGLSFRADGTNTDTRYLRNWIRADLLPALVERTDDRLKERLARLSSLLQGNELLLDRYVSRELQDIIQEGDLSCGAFLGLEPQVRGRVLRAWLQSHLGDLRGLGFRHVDAVARLAAAGQPSGRVSLPRGWTAVRLYDRLRLIEGFCAPRANAYAYELPLEGEVWIEEVGVSVSAWRSSRAEALQPKNACQAIFDRDAIVGCRELRNRRPGDRIQPLGMRGHKKLKDLFIEKRTPRRLRDLLPLLLVDGQVVWVPGHGRSGAAMVNARTREVWNVAMSPVDLLNGG
jgi:tRNA(Ile)-lysidine synthase